MRLSIVIPVYNEKETILSIVIAVESVALPGMEKEIVIVDDHSTDGTREVLKRELGKVPGGLSRPQSREGGRAADRVRLGERRHRSRT